MKNLKALSLIAVLVTALTALLGAGVASGTTLEIGGVKQNKSVTFTMTLEPGTSLLIVDEFGTTTDTCTESTIHGATTSPFTVAGNGEIDGNITTLDYGKCTHTTDVLKPGKLFFAWDGGTNATVTESEAEVTVLSTFFGASAVCKTGTGIHSGTLTGVASGNATFHFHARVNCGILGTATWSGKYNVTLPTGLGVVE